MKFFVSLPFVEESLRQFGPQGQFHELFIVGDAIAAAAQPLELTSRETMPSKLMSRPLPFTAASG
jgi:hypothetical protein